MPRIALVSAFSSDYAVGYPCWAINQRYAKAHGYDAICRVDSMFRLLHRTGFAHRSSLSWTKIWVLLEVLAERKHDWVAWIDADAFVKREETSFEKLLDRLQVPDTVDIVVAKDLTKQCKINGGVMLFRNTTFVHELLQGVWENTERQGAQAMGKKFHEQSALEHAFVKLYGKSFFRTEPAGQWFMRGSQGQGTKVLVVDNEELNSNDLQRCNWVFHGAGKAKSELYAALEESTFEGNEIRPSQLWQVRPIGSRINKDTQLDSVLETLVSSPFHFLDLTGLPSSSSGEQIEHALCKVLSQNHVIKHICLNHNGTKGPINVVRILRDYGHRLESVELAACDLGDCAPELPLLLKTLSERETPLYLDVSKGSCLPSFSDALVSLGFQQSSQRQHPRGYPASFFLVGAIVVVV
mmetsp:Transcript_5190/g.9768  ORF Transcript_5190/g.9768 Transcript_5190/m.9768 type:complete len:410 (+) Transcript_5190:57-1286(+)